MTGGGRGRAARWVAAAAVLGGGGALGVFAAGFPFGCAPRGSSHGEAARPSMLPTPPSAAPQDVLARELAAKEAALADLGYEARAHERLVLAASDGSVDGVATYALVRSAEDGCVRGVFAADAPVTATLVVGQSARGSAEGRGGLVGSDGPVCVHAKDALRLVFQGAPGTAVAVAWHAPRR